MKKAAASALGAAIVLVVAVVLNPTPERHRDRIRAAVAERSPVARALAIGQLAAFSSRYHSLGILSYTTVNGRMGSIGALGMVLVLSGATGGR